MKSDIRIAFLHDLIVTQMIYLVLKIDLAIIEHTPLYVCTKNLRDENMKMEWFQNSLAVCPMNLIQNHSKSIWARDFLITAHIFQTN